MITARSQQMEVQNQLQQANADVLICTQKLQALLNTNESLAIADTVLRRIDISTQIETASLNENPSLQAIQQQIEVSRIEKKLEYSKMMPDITLGYFTQTIQGEQVVKGIARNFSTTDRFTGFQAGIAIPLWFVPYTAKIKAAKLKEQIVQTNAALYTQILSSNYRSLLGEYNKYNNSVTYYEKQAIPEANVIIEQVTRSYKAGAIDYLDYMVNLSRALMLKQNYLDALNSYNQTIISIELLTGKLF